MIIMKEAIKWFNGKKTTIAAMYWMVIVPALPMIFDGNVPNEVDKWVKISGMMLTVLGVGHKAIKRKWDDQ